MSASPIRIVPLLPLLLALGACGGNTPETVTGDEPPPDLGGGGDRPPPAAPNPWATATKADFERIVTEGAVARIHEVQPELDLTKLAEYRTTPASCPEIAGRAVEKLLDLAVVDLAENRLDEAEKTIRLIRARARNRNMAFSGTTMLSEIARRRAGADTAAQETAIAAVMRELPRARFGAATVVFQIFQTQEQVRAQLEQNQQTLLGPDSASTALWFGEVIGGIVANRDRFMAALNAVKAEHDARPAERPYRFSTADLTKARDAREVVVAVWDVGTNPDLFTNQLFTNGAEEPNGRDDDGNGQADDIHGIVSDGAAPNTALLFDPGQQTITQYGGFLQGIMDLRAGMASTPAAQRVLELERSVHDATELEALDVKLDAVGEWAHGTHVAGLLLAGVPQARMAIFRSAWAGESRTYHHRGPTDQEVAAERANIEAIAGFIQRHHVKVVNASLGFTTDYLEGELRYETQRYPTDDAVRARARAIQAKRREGWAWLFQACPDTLFVIAAGNENHDVVEYEDVAASIDAPNVLAIGAVDELGGWAPFTSSNPEHVRLFDHGVAVNSVIPNGDRIPLSGTSMASPNAANLAAKLFSVDPGLTPARAIAAMVETGDPIAAPFNGRIANEERALARIRRERGRPAPAPAAAPATH